MERKYDLNELALTTGLTTRTLRNYLAQDRRASPVKNQNPYETARRVEGGRFRFLSCKRAFQMI